MKRPTVPILNVGWIWYNLRHGELQALYDVRYAVVRRRSLSI